MAVLTLNGKVGSVEGRGSLDTGILKDGIALVAFSRGDKNLKGARITYPFEEKSHEDKNERWEEFDGKLGRFIQEIKDMYDPDIYLVGNSFQGDAQNKEKLTEFLDERGDMFGKIRKSVPRKLIAYLNPANVYSCLEMNTSGEGKYKILRAEDSQLIRTFKLPYAIARGEFQMHSKR